MKMSKMKMGLLAIALVVCIAGASMAAYAQFWVTSNTLTVNNNYAVSLEVIERSNSNVLVRATVTSNYNVFELPVAFQYLVNGVWTDYQTRATDASGVATCLYVLTTNGDASFRAVVNIP